MDISWLVQGLYVVAMLTTLSAQTHMPLWHMTGTIHRKAVENQPPACQRSHYHQIYISRLSEGLSLGATLTRLPARTYMLRLNLAGHFIKNPSGGPASLDCQRPQYHHLDI